MADRMMKSSDLLKLLYVKLQEMFLQQGVIEADETTLKMINEYQIKSYM